MNFATRLGAGVFLLVFAIMALGVIGGLAAECHGTIGLASHYGSESGDTTANLEHFNPNGLTAASRGLPFNTRLKITMLDPRPQMRRYFGMTVIVRVNDRGPYIRGRFLDLSDGAARQIGLTQSGVSKVCAERLP